MRTLATRAIPFAAVLTLFVAASVPAQYFGRNKVQYKHFDFQVLETEHFDIYFYPEERAGVDISARLAERWYARLSRIFEHELRGRQPLVLYASHPDFEHTNIIQGELSEGTGGVACSSREQPALFGGTRDGVSSAGVTFRVNLAGFAVGQFDIARPLQRPGSGWFQFNLIPGF